MAKREDVPLLRLALGRDHTAIDVYGFTADEIGVPLVEVRGGWEHLNLTVEQAQKFGEGLLLAARVARGEAMPTALDEFLQRSKT